MHFPELKEQGRKRMRSGEHERNGCRTSEVFCWGIMMKEAKVFGEVLTQWLSKSKESELDGGFTSD